ncbi:hypothetical protein DFS34DRAFT_623818 [Phlyctochytrium arcticum]|nr:hypothetical protein DFS34DRAFT_623818 [Phlyctochytrium arcticum]
MAKRSCLKPVPTLACLLTAHVLIGGAITVCFFLDKATWAVIALAALLGVLTLLGVLAIIRKSKVFTIMYAIMAVIMLGLSIVHLLMILNIFYPSMVDKVVADRRLIVGESLCDYYSRLGHQDWDMTAHNDTKVNAPNTSNSTLNRVVSRQTNLPTNTTAPAKPMEITMGTPLYGGQIAFLSLGALAAVVLPISRAARRKADPRSSNVFQLSSVPETGTGKTNTLSNSKDMPSLGRPSPKISTLTKVVVDERQANYSNGLGQSPGPDLRTKNVGKNSPFLQVPGSQSAPRPGAPLQNTYPMPPMPTGYPPTYPVQTSRSQRQPTVSAMTTSTVGQFYSVYGGLPNNQTSRSRSAPRDQNPAVFTCSYCSVTLPVHLRNSHQCGADITIKSAGNASFNPYNPVEPTYNIGDQQPYSATYTPDPEFYNAATLKANAKSRHPPSFPLPNTPLSYINLSNSTLLAREGGRELSVIDQRSTMDASVIGAPPEGTLRRVAKPYRPVLDDEIELYPGDTVFVHEAFEDGWGVGENEQGEIGAFPLGVLHPEGNDMPVFQMENIQSSRRESLNFAPR